MSWFVSCHVCRRLLVCAQETRFRDAVFHDDCPLAAECGSSDAVVKIVPAGCHELKMLRLLGGFPWLSVVPHVIKHDVSKGFSAVLMPRLVTLRTMLHRAKELMATGRAPTVQPVLPQELLRTIVDGMNRLAEVWAVQPSCSAFLQDRSRNVLCLPLSVVDRGRVAAAPLGTPGHQA